jgi:hypothetical protein
VKAHQHRRRQRRALDLDHRHVDLAAGIPALVPLAHAVAVQHHRQHARPGQVLRIGVQLDLDAVREVPARRRPPHAGW